MSRWAEPFSFLLSETHGTHMTQAHTCVPSVACVTHTEDRERQTAATESEPADPAPLPLESNEPRTDGPATLTSADRLPPIPTQSRPVPLSCWSRQRPNPAISFIKSGGLLPGARRGTNRGAVGAGDTRIAPGPGGPHGLRRHGQRHHGAQTSRPTPGRWETVVVAIRRRPPSWADPYDMPRLGVSHLSSATHAIRRQVRTRPRPPNRPVLARPHGGGNPAPKGANTNEHPPASMAMPRTTLPCRLVML